MMKRLEGKTAIVTGAARGIGRAIVEKFIAEGASVLLTDIDADTVAATAQALKSDGDRAATLAHDVAEPEQWDAVFARAEDRFGGLDILVNNAALGDDKDIEHVSFAEWRRMLAVNLDGAFLGTQGAIKAMRRSGGGSIVNISSVGAFAGTPVMCAYNASKAGVVALSRNAAVYCGHHGLNIRVNSVHPGLIETDMAREFAAKSTGEDADQAMQSFVAFHPIGRLGRPSDIADGVAFLASDEASFITGTSLVIDGGYLAV